MQVSETKDLKHARREFDEAVLKYIEENEKRLVGVRAMHLEREVKVPDLLILHYSRDLYEVAVMRAHDVSRRRLKAAGKIELQPGGGTPSWRIKR